MADRSEGDINLSSRRRDWQAANLNAETRALLDEDARVFLHQSLSTPCLNAIAACDGCHIEDLAGRRYLDFHGNSLHQLGFAHPRVLAAIRRQLDELSFCTRRYTNRPAVALAKKLLSVAPGSLKQGRVLFCPGGTSAIGMALKLARVATGRHKFVSMWDSFHGASLDAISVGGEEVFRGGIGPLLPGCEHVPPPDPYRCAWRCGDRGGCDLACADYIDYVLSREGDVAAVVAETVRAAPYIPAPDYWRKVRRICDARGALLILDEIPNALGRTGRMFACEHYDAVPDILVLGKGLGGGVLPLAGIIARDGLNVAADRALGHYTHEKNPVLCAAGLATIEAIEEEGLLERARERGRHALERLMQMRDRYKLIGDVRGLGLLLGIELVRDPVTKERATDEAEAVLYRCLSAGLSFKISMGSILTLAPPLVISAADLDRALDIIEEAIAQVAAANRP